MRERGLLVAGAGLIGLWYVALAVSYLRGVIEVLVGQAPSGTGYFAAFVQDAIIGFVLLVWAHRLADWVCCMPGVRPATAEGPPKQDEADPEK
ncbi:MAG: hypothetical protein ACE15C_07030 [Phycisphaerae bacterium]